jgi:hypothetical protein
VLVSIKAENSFYDPLKVGLLIVAVVFFLFTLHGLLTLEWIGEWNFFSEDRSFWILITDISSAIGLVFRVVGSLIAAVAVVAYFIKKGLTTTTTYRILKIVLVIEAIYWFTFITSGFFGFEPAVSALLGNTANTQGTGLWYTASVLISMGIPCMFESTILPIALVQTARNLSPEKPQTKAIKWGLISGTCYIFVWWLNNAGLWIYTAIWKGTEYVTSYPENLFSFIITVFGLLALGIYSTHFTRKSVGSKLEMLKLKTVGAIILIAGLYFLWNYLTWIFFGKPELWSDWYAWFLGHNLDLWALSLPLLGLPLLFRSES